MEQRTRTRTMCPHCKSWIVIPLVGALPGFTPWDTFNPSRMPVGVCEDVGEGVANEWRCADCGEAWTEEGESKENG